MADNETQAATETAERWWRPLHGTCSITIDRANAIAPGGQVVGVYFADVVDASGQRHRFLCKGAYWQGYDVRLFGARPAVGQWEAATAPGETSFDDVDFAELGKLLDDGKPPADNGEGVER